MKTVMFKTEKRTLYLVKVLVEYEGPIFFICEDDFGTNYLGVFSGRIDEKEIWILAKVSIGRLTRVLRDEFTLYDVFKEPEEKFAIVISQDINSLVETEEVVLASELVDALLPTPGEYLELEPNDEHMAEVQDLISCNGPSYNITRSRLDIIVGGDKSRHNIPVYEASVILKAFEEWRLSTLFKTKDPNQKINRSLAPMVLVGTSAASVVFVMDTERIELLDNDVDISFRNVHETLQIQQTSQEIEKYYKDRSDATLRKYGAFLDVLARYDLEVKVETTYGYSGQKQCSELDRMAVNRVRNLIEGFVSEVKESLELQGRLFGIDLAKRIFSFIPNDAEDVISGKISDDTADKLSYSGERVVVNSTGTAFLEKTVIWSMSGEPQKETYRLNAFVGDDVGIESYFQQIEI